MEPFASPIQIPIVRSVTASWLVYGGHILIVLILLAAFRLSEYSIAAVVGVFISLGIQYSSQLDLVKRVDSVLLRSDDQWSVLTHQREILAARLIGTTFVSQWLVILWLKPRGQRIIHIVLARDNTDRDAFRRLSVRLRVPMSHAAP